MNREQKAAIKMGNLLSEQGQPLPSSRALPAMGGMASILDYGPRATNLPQGQATNLMSQRNSLTANYQMTG